jgi:hypothetical protein
MPRIRVTTTYEFDATSAQWFLPMFFQGLAGRVPDECVISLSQTGKGCFESENRGVKSVTEYELLKEPAPKKTEVSIVGLDKPKAEVVAVECLDCKLFGHMTPCVHCGSQNTKKVF